MVFDHMYYQMGLLFFFKLFDWAGGEARWKGSPTFESACHDDFLSSMTPINVDVCMDACCKLPPQRPYDAGTMEKAQLSNAMVASSEKNHSKKSHDHLPPFTLLHHVTRLTIQEHGAMRIHHTIWIAGMDSLWVITTCTDEIYMASLTHEKI